MAYFNGTLHGFNGPGGYVPPVQTTAVYCNTCAEAAIPLPTMEEHTKKRGQGGAWSPGGRHWDTGFKWVPHYGAKCHKCGEEC
jgi:hypothetical protein